MIFLAGGLTNNNNDMKVFLAKIGLKSYFIIYLLIIYILTNPLLLKKQWISLKIYQTERSYDLKFKSQYIFD